MPTVPGLNQPGSNITCRRKSFARKESERRPTFVKNNYSNVTIIHENSKFQFGGDYFFQAPSTHPYTGQGRTATSPRRASCSITYHDPSLRQFDPNSTPVRPPKPTDPIYNTPGPDLESNTNLYEDRKFTLTQAQAIDITCPGE